jgi:hypothetical protein
MPIPTGNTHPFKRTHLAASFSGLLIVALLMGCQRSQTPSDSNGQTQTSDEQKSEQLEDHASTARQNTALEELPPQLPASQLRDGWVQLFDGVTLYGWQTVGDATWRVQAGTIFGDGKQPGFLRTTTPFGDFELRLEFQAPNQTNSGVFLHTGTTPHLPQYECYELNIAPPDNPFPTGSYVHRQKIDPATLKMASSQLTDHWHRYEIRVAGGKSTIRLNGVLILEYEDPQPLGRGYVALQQNTGQVAFRNIQIKPLGLTSLFNGKDLTGWQTHPQLDGKFTVTPQGELRVQGGRGQLEFEQRFADFVLQLQAKTAAANMNSGVFFRCIPGDQMMGYESQIHNGTKSGDRSTPLDCGTGGIFRRQNARIVAAVDGEWLTKTLIATDSHFAVWVNGLLVTDWTDDRSANENPRRGLRTEGGTIMLQAHDPSTDILFRDFRAAEIPTRAR